MNHYYIACIMTLLSLSQLQASETPVIGGAGLLFATPEEVLQFTEMVELEIKTQQLQAELEAKKQESTTLPNPEVAERPAKRIKLRPNTQKFNQAIEENQKKESQEDTKFWLLGSGRRY